MKKITKSIFKIPKEVEVIIRDKKSIPYLEQLRVKEYSGKLSPLKGIQNVIVPWSGGVDSTTSLLMALEGDYSVFTVFVDYGQSYVDSERNSVKTITNILRKSDYKDRYLGHIDVNISWLVQKTRSMFPGSWKHIFPMRNLIILYLSCIEVKEVLKDIHYLWFSPVQGEIPYSGGDKSKVFIHRVKQLIYNDFEIILETPISNLTKGDILNWCQKSSLRRQILVRTFSCFNPQKGLHCSGCQACFNRAVGFYSAGMLDESGVSVNQGFFSKVIDDYNIKLSNEDYYSKMRREEINKFMKYVKECT